MWQWSPEWQVVVVHYESSAESKKRKSSGGKTIRRLVNTRPAYEILPVLQRSAPSDQSKAVVILGDQEPEKVWISKNKKK